MILRYKKLYIRYNMKEETMVLAKTRQVGGSLVITIPSELVKLQQLQPDQFVEIKVRKKKIDYFGALKGIGHYDRKEDRMKDRE